MFICFAAYHTVTLVLRSVGMQPILFLLLIELNTWCIQQALNPLNSACHFVLHMQVKVAFMKWSSMYKLSKKADVVKRTKSKLEVLAHVQMRA